MVHPHVERPAVGGPRLDLRPVVHPRVERFCEKHLYQHRHAGQHSSRYPRRRAPPKQEETTEGVGMFAKVISYLFCPLSELDTTTRILYTSTDNQSQTHTRTLANER